MVLTSTKVLTIAGSDSGGGAGIQADLKTFTSLGAYGTSVITAVTAQNTHGVSGCLGISPAMVSQQLETVLSDIAVGAMKTGMLHGPSVISAVAESLTRLFPAGTRQPALVVDPVMVSTSGHELLEPGGAQMLVQKLLPRATLVTPNLPEALLLSGRKERRLSIDSMPDILASCREIARLGPTNVLLKGGHFDADPHSLSDVLYLADSDTFHCFTHPRLNIPNTHGTGCTLSAAVTVYLGKGLPLVEAVEAAIKYVEGGIQHSFPVGSGIGPLNHFHNIIPRQVPVPTDDHRYPFTSALVSAAGPAWLVFTQSHPFLQGVRDGSLPLSSFQHFLRQDYIFLTHYARIHSLMAFKCDEMDEIDAATTIVKQIVEEAKNHIAMCKAWGLAEEDFLDTVESRETLAYTRYVMEVGFSKSLLELRVATAPCLLGYGEMAMHLKKDPATIKDSSNPYWPWILRYSDAPFQDAVRLGRQVLEDMALKFPPPSPPALLQLKHIFSKAVQLEIDFWQMGLDGQ